MMIKMSVPMPMPMFIRLSFDQPFLSDYPGSWNFIHR